MPRNLVICCDGTSNEFGLENTNVVRLVQSLDRDPTRQRMYYDPGVGTLPEPGVAGKIAKKFSEIKGLAFGAGLSENVEEAYSYLMDFWERGDRVFLFGFSRGAYTVRVLAALLYSLGLLSRGSYNMVPYVMRLFASVRKAGASHDPADKSPYWKLLNQFREAFARPISQDSNDRRFPVYFLGVWDTVSSVGWVWDPVSYPYTARNPGISVIRHAVSLDERRWFFRQNLFQKEGEQNFKEVWFPGVHCDIGGGYPEVEGGLWRNAFQWMVDEARTSGLLMDDQRLQRVLSRTAPPEKPWLEPKHESLTALWWPAEFFPKLQWRPNLRRRLPDIGRGRNRVVKPGAVLHRSTVLRIRESDYAPPNLSKEFIAKLRQLDVVPDAVEYQP